MAARWATLAATGSAKYLEGFGPPMDGFDQVPHGDLEAVKKAIGPHTAGILIEPVQGEGGVRSAPQAFFKALRQLCDEQRPAAGRSTRCRPAWAAPAICSPTSASA